MPVRPGNEPDVVYMPEGDTKRAYGPFGEDNR